MVIPASANKTKTAAVLLIVLFAAGLLTGGLVTYYFINQQISVLQTQVSALRGFQNVTYENITIVENGTSLEALYAAAYSSVVLVQGDTGDGTQQGSGFVYSFDGSMVILTNYHVIDGIESGTLIVTFSNGHGYAATVLGSDLYADLAVINVTASITSERVQLASDLKPLNITSSSALAVGDSVVTIGNPYGLAGSLTTGVVSAVGRTITEDTTANFSIANIIQISTPINPGNSGGPLLNMAGSVVGITTAIVTDSQGIGFAIPSDTILREVSALMQGQTFDHSYLGIAGTDMSYDTRVELSNKTVVTYGWLIGKVESTGTNTPSKGLLHAGDIIIAMNGTTIINGDSLASYLDANTFPGDHMVLTIIRDRAQTQTTVTLGIRPPP